MRVGSLPARIFFLARMERTAAMLSPLRVWMIAA